eukprot:gene4912-6875_t
MSSNNQLLIKQLTNRLENATSTERIEALQELLSLAKSMPEMVGEISLKKVMNFLKDQATIEEYLEALDLVFRLVKNRDPVSTAKNSQIILTETSNVEILLDLLEHEDLTIGVMTSQILTELHANQSDTLEIEIQKCPDGMNKLLQRLPDKKREEVRNQAIVLIQQLTSRNEEMKKTLVFNDGFDIIFGIMDNEGGSEDAGVVIQDCLQICNNILDGSETCQRLFYGMGTDWISPLADFVDPRRLEFVGENRNDVDDADSSVAAVGWFEQPVRISCAVLAISALYCSLSNPNPAHQAKIVSNEHLMKHLAYSISRNGPTDLVNACLSLLYRAAYNNKEIGFNLANKFIQVLPAQSGKTVPIGVELPSLTFGWKPLPNDGRKIISILALLVERYIYSTNTWNTASLSTIKEKLNVEFDMQQSGSNSFSIVCMKVFERILSVDSNSSDLMIQHILAPPPPSHAEMESVGNGMNANNTLESMKPLGNIVLSLLVESCNKILNNQFSGQSPSFKIDLELAEKSANVLALVFSYGTQVSKELATAINSSHVAYGGRGPIIAGEIRPILPFLLSSAGRAARVPNGGFTLLIALLRLLSSVASGCERAVRQMLEDPANLFVVDLASVASESAGVPPIVQISACFFLGCCFEAFPEVSADSNQTEKENDSVLLNRKSFLQMIDSKIGLSRFSELLKKPITVTNNKNQALFSPLFISDGFKQFYEAQVELIKSNIFEYYTGSIDSKQIDSAHQTLIEMQKQRIVELEAMIGNNNINDAIANSNNNDTSNSLNMIKALKNELEALTTEKNSLLLINTELEINNTRLENEVDTWKKQTEITAYKVAILESKENDLKNDILVLKESIINEKEEKKSLQENLEQKERKIELLNQDLLILSSNSSDSKNNVSNYENKIKELEARNAELKQQIWSFETSKNNNNNGNNNEKNGDKSSENEIKSCKDSLLFLGETIFELVKSLEVSLDDSLLFENIIEDLNNNNHDNNSLRSIKQSLILLQSVVFECNESFVSAVGECSDIANTAQIYDLDGDEGTRTRALDCIRQISIKMRELSENSNQIDIHSNNYYDENVAIELELKLNESQEMIKKYKDEIRLSDIKIGDLDGLIVTLENKYQISEMKLIECENNKKALENLIQGMRRELISKSTSQEDLQNQINSLKVEISKSNSSLNLTVSDGDNTGISTMNENDTQKISNNHMKEYELIKDKLLLSVESYKKEKDDTLLLYKNQKILWEKQQSELMNELNNYKNEMNELKTQLQSYHNSKQGWENEEKSYKIKIQDLNELMKTKENEIEIIKTEIKNKNLSKNEIETENQLLINELKNQIIVISNQNNDNDNIIKNYEKELFSKNELMNEKIAEIDYIREKLSSAQEKYYSESVIMEEKDKIMNETQEKLFELQQKYNEIMDENNKIKNDFNNFKITKNDIIQKLNNRIETLEKSLNETAADGVTSADLWRKNDVLIQKNGELERKVDELQQLKQSLIDQEKLKVDELNGIIKKLKTENDDLFEKYNNLIENNNKNEIENNNNYNQLKLSYEELLMKLNESQGQYNELMDNYNKNKENIENNDNNYKILLQSKDELEQVRIPALQAEIIRLNAVVNQLQSSQESLLHQKNDHSDELYHKNEEINSLKIKNEEYNHSIYELQQQADDLKQELDDKTQSMQSHLKENNNNIKKLNEVNELLVNEQLKYQEFMNQINKNQQEKIVLMDEIKQTKDQMNELNEKSNKIIEKLENEIIILTENNNNSNKMKNQEEYDELLIKYNDLKSLENKYEELQIKQKDLYELMTKKNNEIDYLNNRIQELLNNITENKKLVHESELKMNSILLLNQEIERSKDEIVNELMHKKNIISTLEKDMIALKVMNDEQKLMLKNYNTNEDVGAFKAHNNELRRLTLTTDRLAKELNIKESELSNTLALLKRREGETMGILSTLNSLTSDMDNLRVENEMISKKSASDGKVIKDQQRELQHLQESMQLTRGEYESVRVQLQQEKMKSSKLVNDSSSIDSINSEIIFTVETKLRELTTWLGQKYEILIPVIDGNGNGNNNGNNNSYNRNKENSPVNVNNREHNHHSVVINRLLSSLKSMVLSALEKVEDDKNYVKSSLVSKEKELEELRRLTESDISHYQTRNTPNNTAHPNGRYSTPNSHRRYSTTSVGVSSQNLIMKEDYDKSMKEIVKLQTDIKNE